MKNKILVALVCSAIAFSMAGCGTTSTTSSTAASSTTQSSAAETPAPTSQAAAPTETPAVSGYTADQFNQITMGISYDQVKQIMGSEGSVQSETDAGGVKTTIYLWSNSDGISNITVTVQNDVVSGKAQTGIIKTGSVATKDKFDQIQTGMSLDQVNQIMGESGAMISESSIAGTDTSIYMWDGELGTNCTISFSNGTVASKAQFGLE